MLNDCLTAFNSKQYKILCYVPTHYLKRINIPIENLYDYNPKSSIITCFILNQLIIVGTLSFRTYTDKSTNELLKIPILRDFKFIDRST